MIAPKRIDQIRCGYSRVGFIERDAECIKHGAAGGERHARKEVTRQVRERHQQFRVLVWLGIDAWYHGIFY